MYNNVLSHELWIIEMVAIPTSGCSMASASASVDSKAELTALLEQWERQQQGSTQELVNILTKSVEL